MSGVPPHHVINGGWFGPKFDNPWPSWKDPTFRDLSRMAKEWVRSKVGQGHLIGTNNPTKEHFEQVFPLSEIDWESVANPRKDCVQCVWVGHATALVQCGGATFLTDPIFSDRCAPVQFAGPKRVVPPPFTLDSPRLPRIDFVIISHNHYDHLDYNSVMQLYKRFGDALRWYVPLGLKSWFSDCGISNAIEMDWWEDVSDTETGVQLTFTPSQHWSARKGLTDRKRSLWGSWMVESSLGQKVWFAGDTGYCPVFKEVGKKLGPIDLALIPIGAYEPRWFMKAQHVDPIEAVEIHKDIKAKYSVAVHCCTFSLTLEPLDEPPKKLKETLISEGLSPGSFLALRHGEMIQISEGKMINKPKTLPVAKDTSAS